MHDSVCKPMFSESVESFMIMVNSWCLRIAQAVVRMRLEVGAKKPDFVSFDEARILIFSRLNSSNWSRVWRSTLRTAMLAAFRGILF